MIKIRRYKNGDACPCCGQRISGMSEAQLEKFSVLAAAVLLELDPRALLTDYGEDPMEVNVSDLLDALAEWKDREAEP
ncbi:MAG: hypothetical protein IKQ10_03880 [Oscillospiraceae bacterium]|nr:hypothetical protein [Oscillospiraceae bacterium]